MLTLCPKMRSTEIIGLILAAAAAGVITIALLLKP